MKILPLLYKTNFVNLQNNIQNQSRQETQTRDIPFYPQNYQPYFGARLNRTPADFYAQKFNMDNMPDTVRAYLMSDFENNKDKRPMQLQQEAFQWLPECTTIQDIKDMYPDEALFKNLRTLDEIRPKHGYLLELRMKLKKDEDKRVLKSGQDLTNYLVNKIYLEGKDLKEINEDFKNDVREDLLNEAEYGEKGYFLYSTLKSLGISFPDNSYWFSLQATRLDKEYIPTTRTFDPTKERKPRVYKPRAPRVLTQEERQKRSERMIMRWVMLSPSQREKQLEKMRAGLLEKGSIFFDYISPIMIIATEEIKLSDKLVDFFKKDKAECPLDLSKLTNEQSVKLKKFWDENPQLKEDFSKAISDTIKMYESAQVLGQRYIDDLNTIAAVISANNKLKAVKREMSSEETIKNNIRETIMGTFGLIDKPYAEKYMAFVFNHKLFKNDFLSLYRQSIAGNMKLEDKYKDKLSKIIDVIHKEFVKRNPYETLAVNTAVAEVLYQVTKDALLFTANDTSLLLSTIEKNKLQVYIASCSNEIKQKIQEYTSGLPEEIVKASYETFTGMMRQISRTNYLTLSDPIIRARANNLPKVIKKIDKDKNARNHFKNFIRQYEAQVKLVQSETLPKNIRFYLLESMIDDYLVSMGY